MASKSNKRGRRRIGVDMRKARSILFRSCYTRRRRRRRRVPDEACPESSFRDYVQIGDSFYFFPGDSLVSSNYINNNARRPDRVRVDDLRGKTILIYMLPLTVHHHTLPEDVLSLVSSYDEACSDFDFEVILVPVDRGPPSFHDCAKNRFHDLFSKMPWLAITFEDKLACDLVQHTFRFPSCHWLILDPSGKVLLTSAHAPPNVFHVYGLSQLLPLIHTMHPDLLIRDQDVGYVLYYTALELERLLRQEDYEFVKGLTSLNQLLHYPPFLLTKDGNKVSVSSLRDKVVGLYICDNESPPRLQAIKKVYEELIRLHYGFEIIQFNLKNVECRETIPWLTLPYKDSCCNRFARIFNCRHEIKWRGDVLIIIDPHEPSLGGSFFDKPSTDIVQHFGIGAYPFTRRRLYELECARRKEEIKLQLLFSPGGPPLLRHRGGGSHDQVPVSQLWGKRVIVLFATTQDAYKSSYFVARLESEYIEQDMFEVVYVSFADFDSTCGLTVMPWLVHPYSRETAHTWMCEIFGACVFDTINEPVDDGSNRVTFAAFDADGEFMSNADEFLGNYDHISDYPFFHPHEERSSYILYGLALKYGLSELELG